MPVVPEWRRSYREGGERTEAAEESPEKGKVRRSTAAMIATRAPRGARNCTPPPALHDNAWAPYPPSQR